MKKRLIIILAIIIPVSLLIIIFIGLKHAQINFFKHQVYIDPSQSMQFIESKMNLIHLWKEFEIEKANCEILQLIAVQGVMQSGSRFYAKIKYNDEGLKNLMGRIDLNKIYDGSYKSDIIGVDLKGRRYDYNVIKGVDGCESFLIIDPKDNNIVHYYAYGGDGG